MPDLYDVSHKDFTLLLNILDAIEKIKSFSAGYGNADEFFDDTKSFDAAMMNFIVIGEMSAKLSENFRLKTEQHINWLKIIGLRNIIAHNYFGIDAEEVWQIIGNTLIALETSIKAITDN